MKKHIILAINPGSTSTKIALYRDSELLFEKTIRHGSDELAAFPRVADQFAFRKKLILDALAEEKVDIDGIDVIMGRGGLLRPIPSGVYAVNANVIDDLKNARYGEHASNLGALIAGDLASHIEGAAAYIADPVVVDEMEEVARVCGHPLFRRTSVFHALNQKAVARSYAASVGKKYEELNLIIAHLGGGISVAAHRKGRVVDVYNALDGDGAFSPERSGRLPVGQLADLCFSGKYTRDEVKKMLVGKGGVVAHLGTNDMLDVRKRAAAGDAECKLIVEAMAYNVAKDIGSMAAVLGGRVDAVIITGGIAHSKSITGRIRSMTEFIAPVEIFPGEDELGALAASGLMVARRETQPLEY